MPWCHRAQMDFCFLAAGLKRENVATNPRFDDVDVEMEKEDFAHFCVTSLINPCLCWDRQLAGLNGVKSGQGRLFFGPQAQSVWVCLGLFGSAFGRRWSSA